ncbi:MAG: dihydropteroate synthase [Candidatus Omnitrophica bacterium]|nr:dihydropteroate synthase [Candidatus Omnitrophota bacterium]
MRKLEVDAPGIGIMAPKGILRAIKLYDISSVTCNVLKQEMLSIGGEAAVPKWTVTLQKKYSDCILLGTEHQLKKLINKLAYQPHGLKPISKSIAQALENYKKVSFVFKFRGGSLTFGEKTCVMGILNRTPDSFSDGGLYFSDDEALDRALEIIEEGADILDIGGESTRPGSKAVSLKEERARVIPFLKKVRRVVKKPISIDTTKSQIAEEALSEGANIINDVSALNGDSKMAKVIAKHKAGVVLMHSKGTPKTMQKNPTYSSLFRELLSYLGASIEAALAAGVKEDSIIVDPGIGFGKTLEHNLEILKNLSELKVFGLPIMVGPSRKSFIGKVLGAEPDERLLGTASSVACAIQNGAHIVRVHDVKEISQAARLADAITHSAITSK